MADEILSDVKKILGPDIGDFDEVWKGQYDAERLQDYLQVLVGLPLTYEWHPLWQEFEFGPQLPFVDRKGNPCTRADLSLWFCSAYAVMHGTDVVFGSDDQRRKKRRFYERATPPRDPMQRVRWRRVQEFFEAVEAERLVVLAVRAGKYGDLTVELTEDYAIVCCRASVYEDLWTFCDNTHLSVHVDSDGVCVHPKGPLLPQT